MNERFHGGAAVPPGYYLNAARWALEAVAREGDRLPQGPGEWRRVPSLVALALVPVLGVTFLMFMPAAGFIVLGGHLCKKLRGALARRGAARAEQEPPEKG